MILESLVIGLLASLVGLGLGVLLAEGIEALFGSLGVELPSADRVFATRTIVVSLVVGVGITLLAGLFPAIRATRVPPISAVREGATLPQVAVRSVRAVDRGRRRRRSRSSLLGARDVHRRARDGRSAAVDRRRRAAALPRRRDAVVAPRYADRGRRRARPREVRAGGAGRLASGNAVRNPGRTAATAAALMIGIALVSFIATLTNGMKASNREAIEEQVAADYVVTSLDGYTPFVAAAGDALAASPVPEVVTSVRSDAGLVDDVTDGGRRHRAGHDRRRLRLRLAGRGRQRARDARHDEARS